MTWLKPKDSKIKEIYTEALGKSIFIGGIRLSDECITHTDEDYHIFRFDLDSIKHVLLFGDEFYTIHPENAEKLLTILNQATYTLKEKQDWLSTRYPLVVYNTNSFYKIDMLMMNKINYFI